MKDTALWEIALPGGRAHPTFPDWKGGQGDGEWTPDGKYYLFSRVNNGVSQLWALPDRKPWFTQSPRRPVELTTGPMQCFLPTPSPDGRRVLFYGMLERALLLKFDASAHEFKPFLPGVSGAHLDFSRDGQWATYSSYPDHALWRVAANGTQKLQLSPAGMIAMLPVISPDGSKIAFLGGSIGQPYSVQVMGRDGGAIQTITAPEPAGIGEPAWSPDGASLVLGSLSDQPVLYRFDFAGRRLTRLPGSEGLWSPRWSPDGRWIAALHFSDLKLLLFDVKTGKKMELADLGASYPAWSHDGKYLYFASSKEEAWYRVRLRDYKVERLLSLTEAGALPAKPSRGFPTWIHWWTGLAPDNSLLIAKEAGSVEIYSGELVEQ